MDGLGCYRGQPEPCKRLEKPLPKAHYSGPFLHEASQCYLKVELMPVSWYPARQVSMVAVDDGG